MVEMKCGIEIHQRLDTKKLFCDCNSTMAEDSSSEVTRKLRAVPGELGEVDPAALYELLRDKTFVYKTFPNESCLVELDDEPPHQLDSQALKIALRVAKLLHCGIPDEVHVMRKTVIDGSNTCGFQRTAIIGLDGWLKTSKGKVGITNVCLEEEAARIEKKEKGKVVYRLNGLGIPLVEIGTAPDIKSPEHAREVAEKLGLLLRSLNVQRGIGTIRQDVNLSIPGGARVEVKGFQDLRQMESLVRNEVKRQRALLEIKKELNKRKAKVSQIEDVTDVFKDAKTGWIKKAMGKGEKVFCLTLEGFEGLMEKELYEGKTLGRELADFVKAHGPQGLIHSEEDLSKYKLSKEFEKLDNVALIVVTPEKDRQVVEKLRDRIELLFKEVPEETRVAEDSSTKYTRPLPGSARMYPETDVKPIPMKRKFIRSIETPTTLLEKLKELEKKLPSELAGQMVKSDYLPLYEKLSKKADPTTVATTLTSTLKDLKRDGVKVDGLEEKHFKDLFKGLEKKKLAKEALPEVLRKWSNNPDKELKKVLKDLDLEPLSKKDLKKKINQVVKKNKKLVDEQGEHAFGALMGILMEEFRGKVDGKTIAKELKDKLKKFK